MEEKAKKSLSRPKIFLLTFFLVFVLSLALNFCSSLRVYEAAGSSMAPAFQEGDRILFQMGASFRSGDVVILSAGELGMVIKRVIAVEGQHVRVDYDTHCVYVDGVALDEPYINGIMEQPTDSALIYLDLTVPEGSVYVLGDNRNHSSDSRHQLLGPVDERYVLGRALWVISPFQNFGAID